MELEKLASLRMTNIIQYLLHLEPIFKSVCMCGCGYETKNTDDLQQWFFPFDCLMYCATSFLFDLSLSESHVGKEIESI